MLLIYYTTKKADSHRENQLFLYFFFCLFTRIFAWFLSIFAWRASCSFLSDLREIHGIGRSSWFSHLSRNLITSGTPTNPKFLLKAFSIHFLNAKFALALWFTKTIKVGASTAIWVAYMILQTLFFGKRAGLWICSWLRTLLSSLVQILFWFSLWRIDTILKRFFSPSPWRAEIGTIGICFAKSR